MVPNEKRLAITRWLGSLLLPGQVVEVRGLSPFRSRVFATAAAGELERLADYALRLSGECKGVYFTPNPLRTVTCSGSQGSATDLDVERRTWLLIDCDSVRPKDTNATDAERSAAWEVTTSVRETLLARGFDGLVIGSSGNGYHLMVPVDLPNDDESQGLHKRLLVTLKERFDTPSAHVDRMTHNAARIWKLPGTVARKGEHSAERPHREAAIVEMASAPREFAEANTRLLRDAVSHWYTASDTKRNTDAYGKAAIDRECAAVATAEVGNRNNRLNEAAFNLGQLIGGGILGRDTVTAALLYAARGVGLGDAEATATIHSGIEAGIKKPRTAPEKAAADAHVWEEPLPLTHELGLLPFPVDVFPPSLRRFAVEQSWALNVPVDYLGLTMLGVVGGAIGNSKRLRVKAGYFQSAAIYGVFVARPGTKKSAVVSVVAKPLRDAERRYREDHQRTMEIWKAEGGTGKQPTLRRCLTGGGTVEGVIRRLVTNPRGLCMAVDELSGLITGLNQYKSGGKGSDRQFYLSAWDQQPHSAERVDEAQSAYVPRPFLSIVGAIQPDVLGVLRGEPDRLGNPPPDDGFFDRFLVAYPPEPPAAGELWREPTESAVQAWASAIEGLLAIRMAPTGDSQTVPLANAARIAYQSFTEEDAADVNRPDFPDHLRGPWAKLMGYFGRFILILHTLDCVADGLDEHEADAVHVERAAKLVRYFKCHARRAASKIREDWRIKDAEIVRGWIAANANGQVSRADIWRGLRFNSRFHMPSDLDTAIGVLVEFGMLRKLPETSGPKGGRPRRDVYEVYPTARETGV